MAGIKNIHLGNTILRMKLQEVFAYFSIFLVVILCLLGPYIKISTRPNTNWELIAIDVAFITLMASVASQSVYNFKQFSHNLEEETIAQLEEELKNIEESLNLFYLPLSILLTISDQPENAQARAQKIAEINCNKHLAEPRVRAVFKRYMEEKKDPKMLELVYRDVDNLQKKYVMKKQLLIKE